jgi:hypothetical protein
MRKLLVSAISLAAGVAFMAGTASAEGLNTDFNVKDTAGTHQYYVWCTGADDYTATADAGNYKEGQTKVYEEAKAKHGTSCWPVWQGLVQ